MLDPAEFRVEWRRTASRLLLLPALRPRSVPGRMAGASPAWKQDSAQLELGCTHAMLLNFGPGLKSAYVYLQAQAGK